MTPTYSLNRFRWALALIIPVLIVVVLFVSYRFTDPESKPSPAGDRPVESDVLQVGALPVT